MSNLNYQYIDPDFSPEKTDKYTLLLKADNTRFSFAVTESNKLVLLAEGIDINELNGPVTNNNFIFNNYMRRVIGLAGNAFTFVPASLFNPQKTGEFARFLDVKATEKVFSLPFDGENQVIFKVDEPLLAVIAGKFDLNDVVFAPKGWITAMQSNPLKDNLYLNIAGDKVEILSFNDGRLRFYNDFEFKNEDELVYFTSFVVGELQLSPEAVTLILSGEVEPGDKNSSRLSEFFQKVELNNTAIIDMPAQFSSHSSLALTALSLCGSSGAH